MPTIYKEKTNEKSSFRYLSVAKCSQITDQGLHQVQLRIHNFSKLKPLCHPGLHTLLQTSLPQPAWLPPHHRHQVDSKHSILKDFNLFLLQPGQLGGQLLQAALLGSRQMLRHRFRPSCSWSIPPRASQALRARLPRGWRGRSARLGCLLPCSPAPQCRRGRRSFSSCIEGRRHPVQKLFHRDLMRIEHHDLIFQITNPGCENP